MVINQLTGHLGLKIVTSFDLVHNSKPDSNKWFELFSIGYFNHRIDNTDIRYKLQAHNLDLIAVGRDDKSNYIFK